jgi:hypothetical protein
MKAVLCASSQTIARACSLLACDDGESPARLRFPRQRRLLTAADLSALDVERRAGQRECELHEIPRGIGGQVKHTATMINPTYLAQRTRQCTKTLTIRE